MAKKRYEMVRVENGSWEFRTRFKCNTTEEIWKKQCFETKKAALKDFHQVMAKLHREITLVLMNLEKKENLKFTKFNEVTGDYEY